MTKAGAHRYELEVSPAATQQILNLHRDPTVYARVASQIFKTFEDLRRAGPFVGPPDITKLKGYAGLWEIRVFDASGAYRVFFSFGRRGKEKVVAVGHVARKTTDDFPASVYRTAERRVNEWLRDLGAELTRT